MECVEELLRKANIAESFSQFEAERCYLSILDYREDLLLEENRGLCEKVRKTEKERIVHSASIIQRITAT